MCNVWRTKIESATAALRSAQGKQPVPRGREQIGSGLAGGGLPLFLGFSGDRFFQGSARLGEARRCRSDVGRGRVGIWDECGGRVDERADQVGGRNGGGLQGVVMIEHPAGQQRLGGLLDPLVDQGGDFVAEIGRVIEAREFKALQGGARSGLQIIERRSESRYGHGRSSNLGRSEIAQ